MEDDVKWFTEHIKKCKAVHCPIKVCFKAGAKQEREKMENKIEELLKSYPFPIHSYEQAFSVLWSKLANLLKKEGEER